MSNVSRELSHDQRSGGETITALELPSVVAVALLVIGGKYGNGQERVDALTAEGYDYSRVQKCVNELVRVINRYSSQSENGG